MRRTSELNGKDKPLPTRWQRFWNPENGTVLTPALLVSGFVFLATGVIEAAFGHWPALIFLLPLVAMMFLSARSTQIAYRQGYWRSCQDFHSSAVRASQDGFTLESEEFWQRETDRLKVLAMAWHSGNYRRMPWRKRG